MSAVPFIKFYPSDWLSEESLRLVSVAARGLWIDLLCLMAKNERRGYLELNGGVNPTPVQLARLVGLAAHEVEALLGELKQAGTCSVDEKGVIYSRRLVRDTELYNQAVSYGKKGGNPRLTRRVKAPVKAMPKGSSQPSLDSGFWISGIGFSTAFRMVWEDWMAYRTERRFDKYTETGLKQLSKKLAAMGEARATAAIQHSMANNWQGIFEDKNLNSGKPQVPQSEFKLAANMR